MKLAWNSEAPANAVSIPSPLLTHDSGVLRSIGGVQESPDSDGTKGSDTAYELEVPGKLSHR